MEKASFKTVWILTDGKAGDVAQCRGVAAYLPAAEITERTVNPGWRGAIPLPFIGLPSDQKLESIGSPLAPPFPDLIIASGRRTIPYLKSIKSRAPETKIVFLKDPKWSGRSAADLIWIPLHDNTNVSGPNIIRTHTSPHAFTRKKLDELREPAKLRFNAEGQKITAIILGGNSATVTWGEKKAEEFAQSLTEVPLTDRVLITASRRTPQLLRNAVTKALAGHDVWFWDEQGENPYPQMLAAADRIVVTGDSHNMVSEALASGACVFAYRPKGLKKKLHRFLDAMEAQGAIMDASKGLKPFPPQIIDTTPEIAQAVAALTKQ